MKPIQDLRATADQLNSLDAMARMAHPGTVEVRADLLLGLLTEVRQYRHLIEISGNDPFGVLPGHQGPAWFDYMLIKGGWGR